MPRGIFFNHVQVIFYDGTHGGRLYTGQYIPARTFHPAFGIFLDSHVIFHTIDEDAQES